MFIEEGQAKEIISSLGIVIPQGQIANSKEEAALIARDIAGLVVVKAQVPAGKRGKGGGIIMAADAGEAEAAAEKILGLELSGFTVEQVLVEEQVSIAKELYAAFTLDSTSKGPMLIFSTEGGMDIEEVHESHPDKVQMLNINVLDGFSDELAQDVLSKTNLAVDEQKALVGALTKLYENYRKLDAQLLEINPLALTNSTDAAKKVMALDCKLVVDDSALYRQTDVLGEDISERMEGTELELEARTHGLQFIQLDGDVGILANGAGLTMSTMDTVAHYGGQPANFMEVGGDAYKKATPALAIVLKNPSVKSLLVNLCGAYARTDVICEGIIQAWKSLTPTLPVSFCIHGTGDVRAKALIQEELGFTPYDKMDDAVKAAISAARQAGEAA